MSGGTLSVDFSNPSAVAFGSSDVGATVLVTRTDGSINVSTSTTAPYTFTALEDTTQSTIRSIAHYDNIFVCVGDSGCIVTVSVQQPSVVTGVVSPVSDDLLGVTYEATSGNFVAVGRDGVAIYSTNLGSSWTLSAPVGLTTDLRGVASNGDGDVYAVGLGGEGWLSSDGGVTWSDIGTGAGSNNMWAVSGDASNWVYCGNDGLIYKSDPDGSNQTQIVSGVTEALQVMLNNKLVLGNSGTVISLNDALTLATDNTVASVADNFVDGDYDAALGGYITVGGTNVRFTETGEQIPSWGVFSPLSDTYRANDYIILNGYVMLIGTTEYDSTTDKYKYHSRRVRWTAPNTITDFSGVGSGVGDLNGRGQLLFGEVVNDRGILFESESISAISYTGLVADPWNYEKITEGVWSISNPVVTDDNLYFVGSDGLIHYTNGIDVSEVGSSFDMTEFTDFDYTKPVILAYSSEMSALVVFSPYSPYNLHIVGTSTGQHSVITLPTFTVGSDTYVPKTVVPRNDNYLSTLMVSYVNSDNSSSGELNTVQFSFGATNITGQDSLSVSDTSYYDYYYLQIDTGNILLNQEGLKQSVKHLIVRTYADGSTTGYLGVQIKSLEDDDWHSANDPYATISVDDSAAAVSDSAVSNLIAEGDDSSTVLTIPCLATQARMYFSTDGGTTFTETTAYTNSGTREITLDDPLPLGPPRTDLYCYWDNEPAIRINTGDIILATDGTHIVSGSTDWETPTLDRYMPSGASDSDATHIPADPIPAGEGTVKLGVNKLVEGAQIRIYVVPRTDCDCTTIEVTGVAIGMIDTQAQKNETIE